MPFTPVHYQFPRQFLHPGDAGDDKYFPDAGQVILADGADPGQWIKCHWTARFFNFVNDGIEGVTWAMVLNNMPAGTIFVEPSEFSAEFDGLLHTGSFTNSQEGDFYFRGPLTLDFPTAFAVISEFEAPGFFVGTEARIDSEITFGLEPAFGGGGGWFQALQRRR